MKMYRNICPFIAIGICIWLLSVHDASAQSIMNEVMTSYGSKIETWSGIIKKHASNLYWSLVAISMVWTFGQMALRRADLQEFFSELVKFMITTGFFWWMLDNGPRFSKSIVDSMWMIGGEASGLGTSVDPQSLLDVGISVFENAVSSSSVLSPVMSAVSIIMAAILVILFALMSLEIVVIIISSWILGYSGIFLLGFGGSRWTSDIAINFYKTVLQVGVQVMVITLLMGIGKDIVISYVSAIGTSVTIRGLMGLVIVGIVFYGLFLRVPPLVSGVVLGGLGGGMGGGGAFGGTALGAAGSAMAAAGMAKDMVSAGISGGASAAAAAAGGAMAVREAFGGAKEAARTGTGIFEGGAWGNGQSGVMKAFGEAAQFSAEAARQMASGIASMPSDRNSPSFSDRVEETAGAKLAEQIRGPDLGDTGADQDKALRSATEALDPNGDSYVSDEVRAFVTGTRRA